MFRVSRKLLNSLCMLLLSITVQIAHSQDEMPKQSALETQIETSLTNLANASKEDTQAAQVAGVYRKAQQNLTDAEAATAAAASYKQAIDTATEKRTRLEQDIAQMQRKISQTPLGGLTLGDDVNALEQQYAVEQSELSSNQAIQRNLLSELTKLTTRSDIIQSSLTEARANLATSEQQLDSGKKSSSTSSSQEAANVLVQTERELFSAMITMLDLERLSAPVRKSILELELQLANLRVDYHQHRIEKLNTALQALRSSELETTQQQITRMQETLSSEHPIVRTAVELNIAIAKELEETNRQLTSSREQLAVTKEHLRSAQNSFDRLQKQLKIANIDSSLGELLIKERLRIKNLPIYSRQLEERRTQVAHTRLTQYALFDEISDYANASESATRALETETAVRDDIQVDQLGAIHADLTMLFENRDQLLKSLYSTKEQLIKVLDELSLSQQQFLDTSSTYKQLIDNSLWYVRTSPSLSPETFNRLIGSISWLFSADTWHDPLQAMEDSVLERPWLALMMVSIIVLLFLKRHVMVNRLDVIASRVGRVSKDNFVLTLQALLITLLLALPAPLFFYFMGYLVGVPGESIFAENLQNSLQAAANLLLPLSFIQRCFRENGLARVHFGWSEHATHRLRAAFKWFIPIAIFGLFMTAITHWNWDIDTSISSSLGRLGFLILTITLSRIAWVILNPANGVVKNYIATLSTPKQMRYRYLWAPLATLIPLLMALLAALGYYYSALIISAQYSLTMLVAVFGIFTYYLAMRWITIVERRTAFRREQREKLEAAEAAIEEEQAGEASPELSDMPKLTEEDLDTRVRRFIKLFVYIILFFALARIWVNFTTGLSIMDDVTLWYATKAHGNDTAVVAITVHDLVVAIVVIILTFVGARNLPGVIEVALLQPMAVSTGNRYAIASVTSYLIFTIGFIISLSLIGISWSDVQWLIAAVGVGLGFGLKEIFANVIAGLILLFERPVRIGDMITVGDRNSDLTGLISRIRMRATTVTDWDNREIVIPNQELITQTVINWTLSDTSTRVCVDVGVAYDSDPEHVHRVIMDTVTANPQVQDDPKPGVFFLGFGDSALLFKVYAFVRERQLRLSLTHELHVAINKALRENNISIPYPQRDLHIKNGDTAVAAKGTPDTP